jgi:predicted site-specific integrase-resolvase
MKKELFNPQEASKILGVTVQTLQRWDNVGIIKTVRTPAGRRMFPKAEIERLLGDSQPVTTDRLLVIYGRVSSADQKKKGDLDRQVLFIKDKLDLRIYQSISIITDVGSGLNDKRKGLIKLMTMAKAGEVTDLGIRSKDRLTRFGFNYLQFFFESYGVKIHILDESVNDKTVYEELMEDLLSIITSFSGKLYGIRSGKNKLLKDKVKGVIKDVTDLPDQD